MHRGRSAPWGLTTDLSAATRTAADGRAALRMEQTGLDVCQRLQRLESAGRAVTRNQTAAHIEGSHH